MLRALCPLSRQLVSTPRTFTTQLRSMSASYQTVATEAAPKAIGPYVQATKFGDFLFTSYVQSSSQAGPKSCECWC